MKRIILGTASPLYWPQTPAESGWRLLYWMIHLLTEQGLLPQQRAAEYAF